MRKGRFSEEQIIGILKRHEAGFCWFGMHRRPLTSKPFGNQNNSCITRSIGIASGSKSSQSSRKDDLLQDRDHVSQTQPKLFPGL